MTDAQYEAKFQEMQKYIPFLQKVIEKLKVNNAQQGDNPRKAQLQKMEMLHDLLTNKAKKLKMETLMKCEGVLIKLHAKIERQSTLLQNDDSILNNIKLKSNDKPSISTTYHANSSKKEVEEISGPASPPPEVLIDEIDQPVVIPTERRCSPVTIKEKSISSYNKPQQHHSRQDQDHRHHYHHHQRPQQHSSDKHKSEEHFQNIRERVFSTQQDPRGESSGSRHHRHHHDSPKDNRNTKDHHHHHHHHHHHTQKDLNSPKQHSPLTRDSQQLPKDTQLPRSSNKNTKPDSCSPQILQTVKVVITEPLPAHIKEQHFASYRQYPPQNLKPRESICHQNLKTLPQLDPNDKIEKAREVDDAYSPEELWEEYNESYNNKTTNRSTKAVFSRLGDKVSENPSGNSTTTMSAPISIPGRYTPIPDVLKSPPLSANDINNLLLESGGDKLPNDISDIGTRRPQKVDSKPEKQIDSPTNSLDFVRKKFAQISKMNSPQSEMPVSPLMEKKCKEKEGRISSPLPSERVALKYNPHPRQERLLSLSSNDGSESSTQSRVNDPRMKSKLHTTNPLQNPVHLTSPNVNVLPSINLSDPRLKRQNCSSSFPTSSGSNPRKTLLPTPQQAPITSHVPMIYGSRIDPRISKIQPNLATTIPALPARRLSTTQPHYSSEENWDSEPDEPIRPIPRKSEESILAIPRTDPRISSSLDSNKPLPKTTPQKDPPNRRQSISQPKPKNKKQAQSQLPDDLIKARPPKSDSEENWDSEPEVEASSSKKPPNAITESTTQMPKLCENSRFNQMAQQYPQNSIRSSCEMSKNYQSPTQTIAESISQSSKPCGNFQFDSIRKACEKPKNYQPPKHDIEEDWDSEPEVVKNKPTSIHKVGPENFSMEKPLMANTFGNPPHHVSPSPMPPHHLITQNYFNNSHQQIAANFYTPPVPVNSAANNRFSAILNDKSERIKYFEARKQKTAVPKTYKEFRQARERAQAQEAAIKRAAEEAKAKSIAETFKLNTEKETLDIGKSQQKPEITKKTIESNEKKQQGVVKTTPLTKDATKSPAVESTLDKMYRTQNFNSKFPKANTSFKIPKKKTEEKPNEEPNKIKNLEIKTDKKNQNDEISPPQQLEKLDKMKDNKNILNQEKDKKQLPTNSKSENGDNKNTAGQKITQTKQVNKESDEKLSEKPEISQTIPVTKKEHVNTDKKPKQDEKEAQAPKVTKTIKDIHNESENVNKEKKPKPDEKESQVPKVNEDFKPEDKKIALENVKNNRDPRCRPKIKPAENKETEQESEQVIDNSLVKLSDIVITSSNSEVTLKPQANKESENTPETSVDKNKAALEKFNKATQELSPKPQRILRRRNTMVLFGSAPLVDKDKLMKANALLFEDLQEQEKRKRKQEEEDKQNARRNRHLEEMFQKTDDNCTVSTQNIIVGKRRTRTTINFNETVVAMNVFKHLSKKDTSTVNRGSNTTPPPQQQSNKTTRLSLRSKSKTTDKSKYTDDTEDENEEKNSVEIQKDEEQSIKKTGKNNDNDLVERNSSKGKKGNNTAASKNNESKDNVKEVESLKLKDISTQNESTIETFSENDQQPCSSKVKPVKVVVKKKTANKKTTPKQEDSTQAAAAQIPKTDFKPIKDDEHQNCAVSSTSAETPSEEQHKPSFLKASTVYKKEPEDNEPSSTASKSSNPTPTPDANFDVLNDIVQQITKPNGEHILGLLGQILSEDKLEFIKTLIIKTTKENEELTPTDEDKTKKQLSKSNKETEDEEHDEESVDEEEHDNIASSSKAMKNKDKKSPVIKKKRNELDRLNEDIRDMFICEGVITATGRRMCTIMGGQASSKDSCSDTNNKKTSTQIKETENTAKRRGPKRNLEKSRLAASIPLRRSLRGCKANEEDGDDDKSTTESTEDLNSTTDSTSKDTTPRRKMPVLKAHTPIKLPEEQQSKVAPQEKSENANKRKQDSKPCPKSKKSKNVQIIDDEENDNTETESEIETESLQSETVEKDDHLLKIKNVNVHWHNQSKYINWCMICEKKIPANTCAFHYKMHHGENYISRLAPVLLQKFKQGKLSHPIFGVDKGTNRPTWFYRCPFCLQFFNTPMPLWLEHIQNHTAEFRYECSKCHRGSNRVVTTRRHINSQCKGATMINSAVKLTVPTLIKAHVCHLCNFIQLKRTNLERHYMEQHLLDQKNVDVLGYTITLFDVENVDLVPENEAAKRENEAWKSIQTEEQIIDIDDDEEEEIDKDDNKKDKSIKQDVEEKNIATKKEKDNKQKETYSVVECDVDSPAEQQETTQIKQINLATVENDNKTNCQIKKVFKLPEAQTEKYKDSLKSKEHPQEKVAIVSETINQNAESSKKTEKEKVDIVSKPIQENEESSKKTEKEKVAIVSENIKDNEESTKKPEKVNNKPTSNQKESKSTVILSKSPSLKDVTGQVSKKEETTPKLDNKKEKTFEKESNFTSQETKEKKSTNVQIEKAPEAAKRKPIKKAKNQKEIMELQQISQKDKNTCKATNPKVYKNKIVQRKKPQETIINLDIESEDSVEEIEIIIEDDDDAQEIQNELLALAAQAAQQHELEAQQHELEADLTTQQQTEISTVANTETPEVPKTLLSQETNIYGKETHTTLSDIISSSIDNIYKRKSSVNESSDAKKSCFDKQDIASNVFMPTRDENTNSPTIQILAQSIINIEEQSKQSETATEKPLTISMAERLSQRFKGLQDTTTKQNTPPPSSEIVAATESPCTKKTKENPFEKLFNDTVLELEKEKEKFNPTVSQAIIQQNTAKELNETPKTTSTIDEITVISDDEDWEDIEITESAPTNTTSNSGNIQKTKNKGLFQKFGMFKGNNTKTKKHIPPMVFLPKKKTKDKPPQQQQQSTTSSSPTPTIKSTTSTCSSSCNDKSDATTTTNSNTNLGFKPVVVNIMDDLLPDSPCNDPIDLVPELAPLEPLQDLNDISSILDSNLSASINVDDDHHTSMEDALDFISEQQAQDKQQGTSLQTQGKTIINNVTHVGYSVQNSSENPFKFYCLLQNCSFLYSSDAIGLENHFMCEHSQIKWNGYCLMCQAHCFSNIEATEEHSIAKEIKHMLEKHANKPQLDLNTESTQHSTTSSHGSDERPKIKLRRMTGDCLSTATLDNATFSSETIADKVESTNTASTPLSMLGALLIAKQKPPTIEMPPEPQMPLTEPLLLGSNVVEEPTNSMPFKSICQDFLITSVTSAGAIQQKDSPLQISSVISALNPQPPSTPQTQVPKILNVRTLAPKAGNLWAEQIEQERQQLMESAAESLEVSQILANAGRPSTSREPSRAMDDSPGPVLVAETVPVAQAKTGGFVITQTISAQYDEHASAAVGFNINIASTSTGSVATSSHESIPTDLSTPITSRQYKCMANGCKFVSRVTVAMSDHLRFHEKRNLSDKRDYFACAFCSFQASSVEDYMKHAEQYHIINKGGVTSEAIDTATSLNKKIYDLLNSKKTSAQNRNPQKLLQTQIQPEPDSEEVYLKKLRDTIEEIVKPTGLSDDKLYRCVVKNCRTQLTETTFLNHIMFHISSTGGNPNNYNFKCPHCSAQYHRVAGIKAHIKNHALSRFFCYLCEETSANPGQLLKHFSEKHWHTLNMYTKVLLPPKTSNDGSGEVLDSGYFVAYTNVLNDEEVKKFGKKLILEWQRKKSGSKTHFKSSEIDLLPLPAIFQREVNCGECEYKTKVRTNMYRHLLMHKQNPGIANNSGQSKMASVDPVNPVPCLNSTERFFDKMTNLASSSLIPSSPLSAAGSQTTTNTQSKPVFKIPFSYVAEAKRFTCGCPGCSYAAESEENLRLHLTTLHSNNMTFRCPFCRDEICKKGIAPDRISFHLRFHGATLYRCEECNYLHHIRYVVERHINEKHSTLKVEFVIHERSIENNSEGITTKVVFTGKKYKDTSESNQQSQASTSATTTRSSNNDHSSASSSSNTTKGKGKWVCDLCGHKTSTVGQIQTHCQQQHGQKNQYKCAHCNFGSQQLSQILYHIDEKHSGKTREACYMYHKSVNVNDEVGDTRPLWQRNDPTRVRHIRGILMEDEEESEEYRRKLGLSKNADDDDDEDDDEERCYVNTRIDYLLGYEFGCHHCEFKTQKFDDLKSQHYQNVHNSCQETAIPFWYRLHRRLCCPECRQFIGNFSELKKHLLHVHKTQQFYAADITLAENGDSSERILCGYCSFHCATTDQLRRHNFKAQHLPQDVRIENNEQIMDILKLGTSETSYQCTLCTDIFPNTVAIVQHACNAHAGEESFSFRELKNTPIYRCPFCIFTSTVEKDLLRHMIDHYGNFKECYFCSSSQSSFNGYMQHCYAEHRNEIRRFRDIYPFNDLQKYLVNMLILFPNGLIIKKIYLSNTKYGQTNVIDELYEDIYKISQQPPIPRLSIARLVARKSIEAQQKHRASSSSPQPEMIKPLQPLQAKKISKRRCTVAVSQDDNVSKICKPKLATATTPSNTQLEKPKKISQRRQTLTVEHENVSFINSPQEYNAFNAPLQQPKKISKRRCTVAVDHDETPSHSGLSSSPYPLLIERDVSCKKRKISPFLTQEIPHHYPSNLDMEPFSYYGQTPEAIDLTKIHTKVAIGGIKTPLTIDKFKLLFNIECQLKLTKCDDDTQKLDYQDYKHVRKACPASHKIRYN